MSAVAFNGYGSNGIFAAAITDNDRSRTVGSIPPLPPSMTTIGDEDHHCCRRYRLLPQPTMTAIAVVNDDDWSRRLHPTIASIDDDHRQQRPACQKTLGWRHQRRAKPPSDPSHRRLHCRRSLLTKDCNAAVNDDDRCHRLNSTAASDKDDRHWQRPPTPPSVSMIGAVGSTHCRLRRE